MRISVIASGIVGSTTGKGLEKKGHDVVFYDIDSVKLTQLAAEGHEIVTSVQDAVNRSDVLMICAPSPNRNGSVDLRPLISICTEIGNALPICDIVRNVHLIPYFDSPFSAQNALTIKLDVYSFERYLFNHYIDRYSYIKFY